MHCCFLYKVLFFYEGNSYEILRRVSGNFSRHLQRHISDFKCIVKNYYGMGDSAFDMQEFLAMYRQNTDDENKHCDSIR